MNRILVNAFKKNITYYDCPVIGVERYNIYKKIDIPSKAGHHYGMESFRKFCCKNIKKLELDSANGLLVVGRNSSYYLDIDSNNRYHGYVNHDELMYSIANSIVNWLTVLGCIVIIAAGHYTLKSINSMVKNQ